MYKCVIDFIRSIYNGKEFVPLHEPLFKGNERKFVLDAIDSTYVSSVGEYVNKFEEAVKELTGCGSAVACVNGTAALHLSLLIAGVKRDELVITQPLSFVATCNSILHAGAEPVFVDVDRKTLGMSPSALEDFIEHECEFRNGALIHVKSSKRVAACVPVHAFGHPVEIDKVISICENYKLPVIEDATESLGSYYKDKHTGTFGVIGVLSFNGNKTITSGGGGMILTKNESDGKLAKHFSTQSKIPHKWEFDHDSVGFNYRMPNINAALGYAQLEMLDKYIENKRELAELYKEFFEKSEIEFFNEPENSRSNYWLNSIFLKSKHERDEFLNETNENGIQTRPAWRLLSELPMFNKCICMNIENAQFISDRLVNIPSSVRL